VLPESMRELETRQAEAEAELARSS